MVAASWLAACSDDVGAAVNDIVFTDSESADLDESEVEGDTAAPVPMALGCAPGDWLDQWTSPYRVCAAGFVQFEHVAEHGGPAPLGISVFGQFARTYKERQVVWDDVTLHEGAGLDDCTVIDHGNSGHGKSEQVVWFDVGDVTIAWDDPNAGSVLAGKDRSEVVSYSAALPADLWDQPRELRVEPTPGGPLMLPPVIRVASPTLLDVTEPPAGGDVPLSASALRFQWAAGTTEADGAALSLAVVGPIVKGRQRVIRCDLTDDGDFTVPAALAAMLLPPVDVRWTLTRLSAAVSDAGPDGTAKVVALRAASAVWGKSWIE